MCQPSSHTSQMARRIFSPVCLQPPHSLHARHFHVLHRSGRFSSGLSRHEKWKRSKHAPHCIMSPGGSMSACGSTSLPLSTQAPHSHAPAGMVVSGGSRHFWWYCLVHLGVGKGASLQLWGGLRRATGAPASSQAAQAALWGA